jgi:benzoyl-CoA reductase/2-hydroxyglutaryl-CoA dehydratase subunit BcrC/BadD/HgdB
MIPQWHRGTLWGRDRAKLFHDEVAAKVERGEGAAADERVRLMWIGPGLWFNMSFYDEFQREHGAVFVWSMYLAIAADAYPSYDSDPLRALAARMLKVLNILHVPAFNLDWYVREAKRARIDGVVTLAGGTDDDCRETFGYGFLVRSALEKAGIPVLRLGVDNIDASKFDEERVRGRLRTFIHGIEKERSR